MKYSKSPEVECAECGKRFRKTLSQIKKSKSGRHFCCSSHAAAYNNRKYVKRPPPSILTMKDLKEGKTYNAWKARLSNHSRRIYLNSTSDHSCKNCGYDKHIDVCHIKPVASFSESCTVAEVNSLDNLVGLCKNCHWEFDNQLLFLKDFS